MEGRMLFEFCDIKDLCVANTWLRKGEGSRLTVSSGGNQTEIDFVPVGQENRKFLSDVKAIHGELQHRLGVVNLARKKNR